MCTVRYSINLAGFSWWLSSKKSACQCTQPRFDPCVRKIFLEREMATHSSILAWKIPRTEEPGGLQSMGVAKILTQLSDFHYTTNVLGKSRGLRVDWATNWYHCMAFCKFFVHSDCIPDSKSTGSSPSLWAWHSRLISTLPLPLLFRLITSAAASSSLHLTTLHPRCIVGFGQVNAAIWGCFSVHLECPHLSLEFQFLPVSITHSILLHSFIFLYVSPP